MTGPHGYGPSPDYDAEYFAAHNPSLPLDQLLRLWQLRPDLRQALAQLPACPRYLAAQVQFRDPWRDPHERSRRGLLVAFALLAGVLLIVGMGFVGYMALHSGSSDSAKPILPPNDTQKTPNVAAPTTPPVPPVASQRLIPVDLTPNCPQAPDDTDGSGQTYSFDPAKAFDGDPATAWRCEWKEADGQALTMKLDHPMLITSVGLIPGYAKTDADGSDRFAQNRKITRVRWDFGDGTSVKQQVPVSRAIASVKVNVITDKITLTVEETEPGESIVNRSGQRQDAYNGLISVSEIEIMGTDPPTNPNAPPPPPPDIPPPDSSTPAPSPDPPAPPRAPAAHPPPHPASSDDPADSPDPPDPPDPPPPAGDEPPPADPAPQ